MTSSKMRSWLFLLTAWSKLPLTSCIDCGCPSTCNEEALNEKNGGMFRCVDRIKWVMRHHGIPEANACADTSLGPNDDPSTNQDGRKSCRYEACHPEGCGSTLKIEPVVKKVHDCGCPETCTNEVVTETLPNMEFNCEGRIGYIIHHYSSPEWSACAVASKQGYCNKEKCSPELCGSTLTEPQPEAHNCGCPQTCTDDVLSEKLTDTFFNCRGRIHYLLIHHKSNEWNACKKASEEGHCDDYKCNPEHCGSTLDKNAISALLLDPVTATEQNTPPPNDEQKTAASGTDTNPGEPPKTISDIVNKELAKETKTETSTGHHQGKGKGIFAFGGPEEETPSAENTGEEEEKISQKSSSSSLESKSTTNAPQTTKQKNDTPAPPEKSKSFTFLLIFLSFTTGCLTIAITFFVKTRGLILPTSLIQKFQLRRRPDPRSRIWGRKSSFTRDLPPYNSYSDVTTMHPNDDVQQARIKTRKTPSSSWNQYSDDIDDYATSLELPSMS